MTKIFLTAVGIMYFLLSMWCTFQPKATSEKVGFTRSPGQGESEFLVIYGGLELALALMFLLPWYRAETLPTILLICVIVHGCLVAFRLVSFVLYSDFTSMTYQLAAGEIAVFVISLCLAMKNRL